MKMFLCEERFLTLSKDKCYHHIPITFREYIGLKIAGIDCYIQVD